MPEWYQKLLAFLSANRIDVNHEVGTLYLMGNNGSGLSPLYDFLKPEEAAGKTGWDKMAGIMNGTKALNKLNEDDIEAVNRLINTNSLYVVKKAAPYTTVMPVTIDGDNNVSFGGEENAQERIDGDYRWLVAQHHISEKFRGDELNEPYIIRKYGEEAEAFAQKYGLPAYVKGFFVNYEIDPASAEELPFLQNVTDEEEKARLLRDYFGEIMKTPENYLTPEERKALDDEEIDVKDIRVLAYNQGVSVKTYMNRLRDIEDLPKIDYGGEGQAPVTHQKSENEILDEAVENVNRELRSAAKNPVEKELAEAIISLKEYSFNARENSREMEHTFAKIISLKATQKYLGLKPGEEIADGDPRSEKISRMLAEEPANTEKISGDNTFRYFVKKLGADGLTALSRGTDRKPLNEAYNEFCLARKNKVLNNPVNALDYTLLKRNDIDSKRMFFPDKVTADDKWIVPPQNPFGLSCDRTSMVTFAFGKMLEKGYKTEDILNEDKLIDQKKLTGDEAYAQYQINTPENAGQMVNTYLTAYEKCIEYANRQLNAVDSIHPAAIVKMKNGEAFFAIGNYMKDAFQELGTLKKKVDFTPEQEEKFKRLSNEGEIISYLFAASYQSGKSVISLASDEQSNCISAFQYFCSLECCDDIFHRSKKEAAKAGTTVSAYLAGQYEKTKGAPDADVTKLISSSSIAGVAIAKAGVNSIRENVDSVKKYQDKAAADFMDGTFHKAIHLKLGNNMNAETKLADYFDKFSQAPAVQNEQPVLQ